MPETTTTQRTPRQALVRAVEANAQIHAKGLAAQRIARGLVALESTDALATRGDISQSLVRCLTLVRDMMALSSEVVAACDEAVGAT